MKKNHLITGSTGFVGGAIVLELLKETNDNVYCLVRGENIEDCKKKLYESIKTASLAYGKLYSESEITERCFVIKGDLEDFEIPEEIEKGEVKISYLWHSAASLKYSERDREFIEKVNIDGTKSICKLSNKLNVEFFNHISTAYVCGNSNGDIKEVRVAIDKQTNNFYEKSKILGENYLLDNCNAKLRILRPSIVIGHSRTFIPTSFSGMYGFVSGVAFFRKKIETIYGNILNEYSTKILASSQTLLNFIPIDYVASAAVKIGLSNSDKLFFHLTNDHNVKVEDLINRVFEKNKLAKPTCVSDKDNFSDIDQILDEILDFYSDYVLGFKYFNRDNSLSIEGICQKGFDINNKILDEYLSWSIDYFNRGGKKSRLDIKNT